MYYGTREVPCLPTISLGFGSSVRAQFFLLRTHRRSSLEPLLQCYVRHRAQTYATSTSQVYRFPLPHVL